MITRNAVKCFTCGQTIESTHRHDFRRCACPEDDTAVWVDGGHDYLRRMAGDDASFTDLSEETDE